MTPLLLPSPQALLVHRSSKQPILLHARRIGRVPYAASNGSSGDPSPAASSDASTGTTTPPSQSPTKSAGVKNRLRARNQTRRVQLDAPPEMMATPKKKEKKATPPPQRGGPKKWEEMSLAEKALELYVGEKGLLFWLNKFAYASIFIMAGAWILFRFVGPSLGFYQLDAPPLPPTAVLSGKT